MDERFKNLILFHCYATDSEMQEMLPYMGIIAIILIVLMLIMGGISNKNENQRRQEINRTEQIAI